MLVPSPRPERPDLTRIKRIAADAVLALKLGRGDELLHAVVAHDVAEMRVSKLRRPDPLLLFLHAPARLQRKAHRPLQVLR